MAAAVRNLASRSIHIKIHPTASSLPERREVLRVLERFGEVEMFRSLKYDPTSPVPNAFHSILSTEAAAQAAIDASPIRYRLITGYSPLAHSSDSDFPVDASSSPNSTSTSNQDTSPTNESIFELCISPSPYPHALFIASSPLHSSFSPVSPRRSSIAADLSSRIPASISKPGLVDWVTDSAKVGSGRSLRTANDREEGKAEWGRGAGVGWDETKPWRLRDKERKKREAAVPRVMRGLRSLLEAQP